MILQEYSLRAKQAFRWSSFNPEERGERLISDYSTELESDINELKEKGYTATERYIERYKQFFSAYIAARSRVANPMITGPSRFPVSRNQKALRSEDKHYNVWREWREKAKKSIFKSLEPDKTFNSELERLKSELESMKANHERMKAGNKVISKAKKDGTDLTEYLINEFNIQRHMIEWTMRFGFGLTNNLTNIKNREQRLRELERKEAARKTAEEQGNDSNEFTIEGGKIVLNFEENRLQIIYNDKPDDSERTRLKSNGFKWAPSQGAWQRQLTNNALWSTERLFNIKLKRV